MPLPALDALRSGVAVHWRVKLVLRQVLAHLLGYTVRFWNMQKYVKAF